MQPSKNFWFVLMLVGAGLAYYAWFVGAEAPQPPSTAAYTDGGDAQ